MIVSHFIRWIETAKVSERAAGAAALARAYVQKELPFEDRCAAEAALTLLLDDPSWKVRQALAEAVSMSPIAPPQIIGALACDQPEVAALVIARSPLLADADLIEHVITGNGATQKLVAARARVTMPLAAAIAEIGECDACAVLVANTGADISPQSFRRMAERFGDQARLRELMIRDKRLPSDSRHALLIKVGEALSGSRLVKAVIGGVHAERVARNACVKASISLIENAGHDEYPALVEHIRVRGDLTTSFLVRAVAYGKVDFFGAALALLTGQGESRVRSLLASGFDTALCALFGKAGLGQQTHKVFLAALKVWRAVARGKRVAGPQEVSWLMLGAIGGQAAQGDLAGLLKSIHLDALRANARGHALAIAAA